MAGVAEASAAEHARRPGWGAWLSFAPLLLWLALFVVIPSGLLVVCSFCERDVLGRPVHAFTWENYPKAVDWQVWREVPAAIARDGWTGWTASWAEMVNLRVILRSVWYAFLTTAICLVAGYPVAFFIARAPERFRGLLMMLVMIPFWTSFLIRTYAWIAILSTNGFLNAVLLSAGIVGEPLSIMYTPSAVVLGLVYNYLPFMILPIYTSVEKLDNAMIEAAYDLGASPVRAFSKVIFPLTQPGIAAGVLLVFVPAIAMFAITTLMGGGTDPTVGEVIHKQFFSARNAPFGAALGAIVMLFFFFSLWLMRSKKRGA